MYFAVVAVFMRYVTSTYGQTSHKCIGASGGRGVEQVKPGQGAATPGPQLLKVPTKSPGQRKSRQVAKGQRSQTIFAKGHSPVPPRLLQPSHPAPLTRCCSTGSFPKGFLPGPMIIGEKEGNTKPVRSSLPAQNYPIYLAQFVDGA